MTEKGQPQQKAFVTFYLTLVILGVFITIGASFAFFIFSLQKTLNNNTISTTAYYSAESGIEDALLRLKKGMPWSSPLVLSIKDGHVTTTISDAIGGARVIVAAGNVRERIRKVNAVYQIDTQEASFYYGAQIGNGGMIMESGSEIRGNVFSNGNVTGAGTVTDSAVVARNGNKIDGLTVEGNAKVHTCKNSTIGGTLTYVSGGSVQNCTAGSTVDGGPNEIQPEDFAITQTMIDNWKSDAEAGGVIIGNLTVDTDRSLGPVKILGNLLVKGAKLTITGTIWATGTFDTGNNVEVELDDSYGDLSGVLMADGNVKIRNNAKLEGTDSPSSYLLIISNSPSLSETSAAIDVKNNALGSILFAPNGIMVINNNVALIEATAYQLLLKNNAIINYEIGLENLNFTSGPAGGWQVTSWREVP